METNKLYVGGIPWSLEWQDVKDLFKKHGKVNHVKMIKDRETGKSKGYGFVEFETVDFAITARNELNGIDLEGSILRVEFVEEK